MVRLKLRTCSTNGISMKTSRLAQAVTSHSLIIVREFDLMQGISEPYPGSVKHMRAAKIGRRIAVCRKRTTRTTHCHEMLHKPESLPVYGSSATPMMKSSSVMKREMEIRAASH